MRFRLTPVRMAKTNKIKIVDAGEGSVDAGEGAGKEKQLLIAGGHYRNQCGDSSYSQK